MRIKYLLFILSVCIIFFSVLLLINKEEDLKVITSNNIYSLKRTSNVEYVRFSLLMNKAKSYYYNKEYIDSIQLYNEEELIPFKVKEVLLTEKDITINEELYNQVLFIVEVDFYSENLLIELPNCNLLITYSNNEQIDVYFGDFYYLFNESDNTDLSLGNYKATVSESMGKKSVSGLYLSLHNNTSSNMMIKEFQIISGTVKLNNDYSVEMIRDIKMFETPSDILLTNYNEVKKQINPKVHSLRSQEEKMFYIPVCKENEEDFIHRFMVKITYIKNDKEYHYYIDDFPFINTSIFTDEYDEGFTYYEHKNK